MRRLFRLGLSPDHIARAVDDELAFHLDMRVQKLVAQGFAADDARREALRQFGSVTPIRDACVSLDKDGERAMKRIRYAEELRQDAAFAVRALRRNPAFALIAVLTLALGIGANTAIFTLIDAVMLRTLPVRAPQQLISIGSPTSVGSIANGTPRSDVVSYPLYRDIRANTNLVSGLLAAGRTGRLDVRINGSVPEHPLGRFVSGNYFDVLGVPAQRGRLFGPSEDDAIGASPTVVISDQYWSSRFARDPGVIGRTLVVNDVPLTIIGVTPPSFTGEVVGRGSDVWLPITMQSVLQPHGPMLDDRSASWLQLIGRLAPGVTIQQAQVGLPPLVHRLMLAHPIKGLDSTLIKRDTVRVASAANGLSRLRKTYSKPLFTMMAGVALLLCIICANVANLLLARALARRPELSVRLAMGAGRYRLLRQLLAESAVLAGLGAMVGLALAWAGGRLLVALVADNGPAVPLDVRLDPRVLGFTVVVSALAVALFGLAPAIRAARLDIAAVLRTRGATGGDGSRGSRFPMGRLLIAGQVALSLVLLMGAGLLVRSLRNLEGTDLGIDRDHILVLSIDAQSRGYADERLHSLTDALRDRLQRIPGVGAVTYSENGLFSGTESASIVLVPGFVAKNPRDSVAFGDQIGESYATAIGARVIAGRDFNQQDMDAHGPHNALVNESFARLYFGSQNPVGRTFRLDDTQTVTIVGLINDVRDHVLDAPAPRRFYLPYPQATLGPEGSLRFEIRTTTDPAQLVNAVRAAVTAQDPLLPIDTAQPLTVSMQQSVLEERLLARVATGFGVLALILASIGLYGVMTYAVTRRTGEIGLRIALGGAPAAMVRMVLGDAMLLVGLGVAGGIPLIWAAARLLDTQLHDVGAFDFRAGAVALAVLVIAAVAAALVPALRAAKVAPLTALRQQ